MIELSPDLQQRIEACVALGPFNEPNEVMQAALDLLESRQNEYAQLGVAIEQVERGELLSYDVEDIKRRGRERQG